MSDYIRTDLKIKQPDGSFKKYSPTVTLDSVIMDDGTSLSSKLIDNGDKYNGTAANVPWTGVQNAPTTVEGFGITDAVKSSDVSYEAVPDKIVKLGSDGKINANAIPQHVEITTFTLDDI